MVLRYVVEKVDVDGDGIPDGDLVKQYDDDRLLSQRFVPADKMQALAKNATQEAANTGRKEQVVYQRQPLHEEQKPLVIQSDTSFGHYVKAGAGITLGSVAMEGVLSGLGALFSGDGGAPRRKRRIAMA